MPPTLFKFVLRTNGPLQLVVTALSCAVFLLALVPLELQRRIINDVVSDGNIRLLVILSLSYFGVVLVHGATKYLMSVLRGKIAEATNRHLRREIIENTGSVEARKKTAGGDDGAEGVVVSMISAEVEPLSGFVGESISGPVMQAGILLSVLGYMVWVEPLLAAVAVGLLIPQLFFVPPLQNIINDLARRRIETLRELSEAVVQRSEGNQIDGQKLCLECMPNFDKIYQFRLRIYRWKFLMKFLVNFLEHLGTLGIVSIGGWLVIRGSTEIGTIVAFVSGLQRMGAPWRALILYFRQLTDARIKYDLIRDALQAPESLAPRG